MGMSRSDFCSCTPSEFEAAARHHRAERERADRAAWERTRLHATLTVQPHIRGHIDPLRLMPLPWDSETHRPAAPERAEPQEASTPERLAALLAARKQN